MKAIILAAGEGIRMRPLTLDIPKPLLKYRGKTNLDHIFELLPEEIDGVIIVVRYLADKIKNHCGSFFHGRKIHYVEGSKEGNAYSCLAARNFFKDGERFAVTYGDEVFTGDELKRCLEHKYSWLCYNVLNPKDVGIVMTSPQGRILEIIEKPDIPKSNLVANGFIVVDTSIFNIDPKLHSKGEFYFSDMMKDFIKENEVFAVRASFGHTQLTSPEDIERLNN